MEKYCVNCKKYTENEKSNVRKNKENIRLIKFCCVWQGKIKKKSFIKKRTTQFWSILIKFLLTGDKFMPELHLKQPEFTYSACGPVTKHY